MKILLIEDNSWLSRIITRGLIEEGYEVDPVDSSIDGKLYTKSRAYDLIILDIMLLKKDGIQFYKTIRAQRRNTPILILMNRYMEKFKDVSLSSEVDDYMIKPFALNDLLVKIRALLQRQDLEKTRKLIFGELEIDQVAHKVVYKNRPIRLSNKEYNILEYFLFHPKMVITRTMLKKHIWNYEFESISNLIDVYIRRLRHKTGDKDSPILTIRGAGYRLKI